MHVECGICEYKGDLADAPWFLCLTCADAIRRLVWIREREQQAADTQRAAPRQAAAGRDKAASNSRI